MPYLTRRETFRLDKLHNIDDLLRNAAATQDLPEVTADAWLGVEKKLKRRRIRVAALWILLPLFFLSLSILTFQHFSSTAKDTYNKYTVNQNESAKTLKDDKSVTSSQKNGGNLPAIKPPVFSGKTQAPKQAKPSINLALGEKDLTPNEVPNTLFNAPSFPKIVLDPKLNVTLNTGLSPFTITPRIVSIPNHTSTKKMRKGYWEVGYAFTPSISGKYAAENAANAWLINKNYENFVLNNENTAFASSQGINLQYHRKNWFVSSGLFVSQRRERIAYDYTITEFPLANQNTKEIQYLPLTPNQYKSIQYSGSNSYHFVEIPLNIGYKHTLSPKFELRAQTGISVLQLVDRKGSKADLFNLDLKPLEAIGFNETNIATNVKAGLYYNTRFVIVGVEPTGSINTTNFANQDSGLKLRPFNYGLNIVTQIKLRN